MNDEKITISRSYTRKINLGNYESEDFWASRTIELPAGTPLSKQREASDDLFTLVLTDVERDIRKVKELRDATTGIISSSKLKELIDAVSIGRPIQVEDFEKLDAVQNGKIQEAKRAYKRQVYKEKNGN